MSDDLIVIGRVQRAIGLQGECAVEVYGATLENLNCPAELLIGKHESATRPIIVKEIEYRPKSVVCRFVDIDDRESVELIREQYLFIDRKKLPSLGENEFYHFELKGMEVFSDNSEWIGVVENIYNFPTIDSLEVRRRNGDLVMIPLNSDSVVKIDSHQNKIIVKNDFIEELF